MGTDDEFTIGMLADRADVEVQTIRFYERRGLLPPVGRTASGYRLYNNGSLTRLLFIRRTKELGFTLKEIGTLLTLSVENRESCNIVKQKALDKLKSTEEKIRTLGELQKALNGLINSCDRRTTTEACPILKSVETILPGKRGLRG